jgi:hypothetical protein
MQMDMKRSIIFQKKLLTCPQHMQLQAKAVQSGKMGGEMTPLFGTQPNLICT